SFATNQTTIVSEPVGVEFFSEVGTSAGVNSSSADLMSAWADYDADGDLDLYVGSDVANTLYTNNNNGTFTDANIVLLEDAGNARSVNWGDYDNDGDLDLFVSNNGAANKLFRNDGGGSFSDQSATATVNDAGAGAGSAWGDFDGDGDLDLYHGREATSGNILYSNDGDGTFTQVGGNEVDGTKDTYGVAFADYDDDGDLDLYVANHGAASTLFRNDLGTYNDANITAVELTGTSPGATWADYDNDGDMDLYFSSLSNDYLFRNDGGETFVPVGGVLGLVDPVQNLGSAFADYDNDGDLDLYVANSSTGNDKLYLNNGDGTFGDNVAPGAGLVTSYSTPSYGPSWADYDNDGDLDIYVPRYGAETNKLFRNDNSSGNKYLIVKLNETVSAPDGIGSSVEAWVGANVQRRDVDGGSGYQSQGSLAVEFGLAATTTLDSLIVRWQSGNITKQTSVATNQTLTVNEPAAFFQDVSATAGVDNGGAATGMAWADFDNDGDQDIFFAAGSQADILYRNNGDGTFTNIASTAGTDDTNADNGAAWGDYDADGDLDLAVTRATPFADFLYRNNGDNTFTELAGS
ncbi:MAG: VCBS repeat-containing protein, partial [Candidatus Latescibacterota bacterium]